MPTYILNLILNSVNAGGCRALEVYKMSSLKRVQNTLSFCFYGSEFLFDFVRLFGVYDTFQLRNGGLEARQYFESSHINYSEAPNSNHNMLDCLKKFDELYKCLASIYIAAYLQIEIERIGF